MHILALELLAVAAFTAGISANTTTSSQGVTMSSSNPIGDYVAAGLGLVDAMTTQAVSAVPVAYANKTFTGPMASATDGGSLSGISQNGSTTRVDGNIVEIPSTSYFTSCDPDPLSQNYPKCDTSSTIVTKTFTNTTWAPVANTDACWTQWTSYWSIHKPSPATISVISYALPETTETTHYLYTEGSYVTDQSTTTTITSTGPTVADNGGFVQTMSQVVVTYTTVLSAFLSANTTSTSMYTRTYISWSKNYTLISASNDADWPLPQCTLPAIYPACQSQWEEYATHNIVPNPQPLSGRYDRSL